MTMRIQSFLPIFLFVFFSLAVSVIAGNTKPTFEEIRLAAEQGHAEAQRILGVVYFTGQGVPQDYKEAALWFRKAAEQGHAEAQRILGVVYFTGQGVPQDSKEAYAWFNLGAAKGDEHAMKHRDTVATILDPAALSEAQNLSKEYYKIYVEPFQ